MSWRGFFYGLCLWLAGLIFPEPVYAYIESGSTSFLAQAVIIALISLIFSVKFSFKFLNSKKLRYFSLILLSFSSPLFIYSQNLDKASFVQIITVLITVLILVISFSWFLDFTAAAVSLILFFSYGHIYALIRNFLIVESKLGVNFYLALFYLAVSIACFFLLIKNKSKLISSSKFFSLFSLSLFLTVLANLFINNILDKINKTKLSTAPSVINSQELPDIYYIIFDEYARQDSLKELINFDNQEINSFLESKGFYIASNSYANYSITFSSLTSSLNMEYLDNLVKNDNPIPKNRLIFHQMINNNKVAQLLKAKGYGIINLSRKAWGPLGSGSKYADIDLVTNEKAEFYRIVWSTTILNPFFTADILKPYLPQALKQDPKEMSLRIFKELSKIPVNPQPTFTYAHIFLPHTPYYFNRFGKLNSGNITRPNKTLYLEQLMFTNTKIKELVTTIQEQSSTPPIIILQSDTGPNLSRTMTTSFSQLTPDQLQERFAILNAYYLPSKNQEVLYESISPINTFRLIFNQYFGVQLPLLEDKHYFVNYKNLYKFYPVTLL